MFLGGEDAGNLSLSVEFAHGSAAANPVVLTSVDTPLSIWGRWLFSLERYPDHEYLGPAFRITGDEAIIVGRRDAGSFEITQAIDADGNPIFVPLPYDNSMLIPVLELRFKSTADIQPGRAYSVRLQLLDDVRPPFANEFGIEIDLTINVPWPRSGDGAGRTAGAQGETAVMAPDLDGAEDMLAPQSSPLSIDIL